MTQSEFTGTLNEFQDLADAQLAQEWKLRYMVLRAQMLPDVGRWMRLLRFFHPKRLQDHWQDQFGNPLPKLYKSRGLSIEIYNWCRPIIEVYGSLLAGQKPMPFGIDVPPEDATSELSLFMADSQEKLIVDELYEQRIPLHFLDFCISVVLFGIGYAHTWIDPETRRLRTQTIPWPGDVLPQWGSDRYGRGPDAIESVILTERIPYDTAKRLFPDKEFNPVVLTPDYRPDSSMTPNFRPGNVQIIKPWWRWSELSRSGKRKDHIGYAEIAFDGTTSGEPEVLYREDDTEYPDIPIRWAARVQTPGEPPHAAAGVLDDIVGINTEYNEKLSAFADLVMKSVYNKYKGKGFTAQNAPRFPEDSNVIPMGFNQDLVPLQESINNFPFDSFLGRLESMILTISGLSRLIMGSVPAGTESSGEALNQLLHASISRLELIRSPIQGAWSSMFDDLWVPLMKTYYRFPAKTTTGKSKKVTAGKLLEGFTKTLWTWPDVTPRDSIKTAQLVMNLTNAGLMSRETGMSRIQITSVVDEIEKLRKERQDEILNPTDVRNTLMVKAMEQQMKQSAIQMQAKLLGTDAGSAVRESGPLNLQNAPGELDQANVEMQAARTPQLSEADNAGAGIPQGSLANAAQGVHA